MPANSTKTTTSTETAVMVTTTNSTIEHNRTQYTFIHGIQAIQYRIAMPDAPFSILADSVGRGEGEGGGGTPTGAHRQHSIHYYMSYIAHVIPVIYCYCKHILLTPILTYKRIQLG